MTQRIANNHYPKHHDALAYVNRLIIDLKLQLCGHEPHEPITMERLNEWTKTHGPDVERCALDMRVRR